MTRVSRILNFIKALLSGASLTLTVICGMGIMSILHSIAKAYWPLPAMSRWLNTLPDNVWFEIAATGSLFVGTTWLSAHARETWVVVIHRMAVAFVTVGIYTMAFPFGPPILTGVSEPAPVSPTPLGQYLWLIPCTVPLLIALIKHRRGGRIQGAA